MSSMLTLLRFIGDFITGRSSAPIFREQIRLRDFQISVLERELAECKAKVQSLEAENQNLKQLSQGLQKKVEELSKTHDLHPAGVSGVETDSPRWAKIRKQLKE